MIPAIIAFFLLSIVGLIGFFISSSKQKAAGQIINNRRIILAYLAFGLVMSCGGLIALSPVASHSMTYFMLLQLAYAGLGILAAWMYKRFAPLELSQGRFASAFFVLANTFLGMLGFVLVYQFFSPDDLAPWYALCVLPFLLPQFLSTVFKAYQAIPQEIHKVWYFPLHSDPVDYDNVDTSTIYMLELEYSKSINDPRLTNTKLRAPVSMKFGDWFRSFIENYNYRYESDPIQYAYEDRTPIGWIFYTKPSALGSSQYIDPELTIAENKITEKNPILAKRVGIVEEASQVAY